MRAGNGGGGLVLMERATDSFSDFELNKLEKQLHWVLGEDLAQYSTVADGWQVRFL